MLEKVNCRISKRLKKLISSYEVKTQMFYKQKMMKVCKRLIKADMQLRFKC